MLDIKRREFTALVGGGGLLLAADVTAVASHPQMRFSGSQRTQSMPHLASVLPQGRKSANNSY
jgi:hypothetical protein